MPDPQCPPVCPYAKQIEKSSLLSDILMERIKHLETLVEKGFDKVEQKIDGLDEKYALKNELKTLKEKYNWIIAGMWGLLAVIAYYFLSALAKLVGLTT